RAAGDEAGAQRQSADLEQAERLAVCHRVPGKRRHDDEQIQPRLCQRDEITGPRADRRDRDGGGSHGRASAPSGGFTSGLRTRTPTGSRPADLHVRSVSTSDVPRTSAPLTTCSVLIAGSLPLQITNAPSVI